MKKQQQEQKEARQKEVKVEKEKQQETQQKEHQIIAVGTRALVNYLESKGFDADHLLHKYNLKREDIFSSANLVNAHSVASFWDEVRQTLGDPILHIKMSKYFRTGSFRALEYLILSSETLGEGLENLGRFVTTVCSFLTFTTKTRGDEFALIMEGNDDSFPATPFWVEMGFMVIYSLTLKKIEGSLHVERICMTHSPCVPIEEYEKLFDGTTVLFNRDINGIVLHKDFWNAKMQFADKELAQSLLSYLENVPQENNHGSSESHLIKKIGQYFMQKIPGREPKIEDLAHHLGMSVRNLQRHIKEEGKTFSDLLDETKEKLAIRYLQDDDLTLADISFLLGFSDQSTFQRAFRRWRGKSPGAFRKEDLSG